ncbi:YhdH/YhfP family quinone oxidoreductase [Zunongwangia atlantica]|uniref:YhdH/YhfP family quinone oxidoreductase n=1 Tax=Zunongwangia atlantica 22II14-10F7 TaxID=1185767 RepID=A0A1Y1T170_9FLAO|nr:YhdH/YhfP family quinone oxidoreductase [Zunongwangia atlantica]ORL44778.1 YhdH/YhfP family quinone oxidoreductase [Zunongwangia atlantica 22II14-10F7]
MKKNIINFKAFRVEEIKGDFKSSIKKVSISSIEPNEIIVKVHYSSLNYKDALSSIGNKGVTKKYPHTPGIDAVGIIVQSKTESFKVGDKVIVTGFDLGMNTNGGFGQYIKVPGEWALRLPINMTMKESVVIGTAGLTAGICVSKLTKLITPKDGKVVVSGATGGVGSLAIYILNKLGYTVVAITGKVSETEYLKKLGASEILMRNEIENYKNKPLLKSKFAGAIDTLGGVILQNIIKSTSHYGAITCCGNVASPNLELTVFPFILKGVSLIGIDSQNYPIKYRIEIWNKFAEEWKIDHELIAYSEINLDQLQDKISLLLSGKSKGRTIVNLDNKLP